MQTITYRNKLKITWKDDLLVISFSMFLVGSSVASDLSSAWPPGPEWGADQLLKIIILLPVLVAAAVFFFRAALPRHNALQFDEDGLTYKYAGQSRAWPWREVSAFTLVREWRGPRIEFTVGRDDGRRRTGPLRRTKAGLTGEIPNIWDTPIEDITATLNAYRERAVGGHDKSSAPQPPKPA